MNPVVYHSNALKDQAEAEEREHEPAEDEAVSLSRRRQVPAAALQVPAHHVLQVCRRLVVLDTVEPERADVAYVFEAVDELVVALIPRFSLLLRARVIERDYLRLDFLDADQGEDAVEDGEDGDQDWKFADLTRALISHVDESHDEPAEDSDLEALSHVADDHSCLSQVCVILEVGARPRLIKFVAFVWVRATGSCGCIIGLVVVGHVEESEI